MIYALTAIWYVYVYIQSDPRISHHDVSLAKKKKKKKRMFRTEVHWIFTGNWSFKQNFAYIYKKKKKFESAYTFISVFLWHV